MKICTACGLEKSFEDFRKQSKTKDGYKYRCKECDNLAAREYYKRKKDKIEELKGIRTRVEVGQRNNTHFEITSGISSGAVVYVPTLDQLTRDNSSFRE